MSAIDNIPSGDNQLNDWSPQNEPNTGELTIGTDAGVEGDVLGFSISAEESVVVSDLTLVSTSNSETNYYGINYTIGDDGESILTLDGEADSYLTNEIMFYGLYTFTHTDTYDQTYCLTINSIYAAAYDDGNKEGADWKLPAINVFL